jgi:hypothetical protein
MAIRTLPQLRVYRWRPLYLSPRLWQALENFSITFYWRESVMALLARCFWHSTRAHINKWQSRCLKLALRTGNSLNLPGLKYNP